MLNPWTFFKDTNTPTALLDRLKDSGVDTEKLRALVVDNKDLMLWLFDLANIEKQRSKNFPSWSKEQAFYEAQATPTDVFRMLNAEYEAESKIIQMNVEEEIERKKYGN